MLNFLGAGGGDQFGQRTAADAGERKVDDIGIAEKVEKKRLNGIQRVGSSELEQDYP
jgi:hypothetical protein